MGIRDERRAMTPANDIEELVGRYVTRLDPPTLRALGCDRFPAIPLLHLVQRRDLS